MLKMNCPECNYDLSSLFSVNKISNKVKADKAILTCEDCNSKIKVDNKDNVQSLTLITEVKKGLKIGLYEPSVYIGEESKQEMYDRLFNAYQTKCMICDNTVGIHQSHLVRISTDIFPKREEEIHTFSPAHNPVIEYKTKYLPPVKEKGRICGKCLDLYSTIKQIEVLPDPKNIIRDGMRNVPYTGPIPKFEKPIVDPVPTDMNNIKGVWDDDVIEGFDFSVMVQKPDRRVNFRPRAEGEVERRKNREDRRKKIRFAVTVQSKPSHRVRDFREDKEPKEVKGFHRPNIERRRAFIKEGL